MRQPEVERELRALGERAEQDEDQRRKVQRMRSDTIARAEKPVEVVTADDAPEEQRPGEKAQPARRGDHERDARPVARSGVCGASSRSAGTRTGW
jgi:hypothetical protein